LAIERRYAVRHFATIWAALALAAGLAMAGSVVAAPARQDKLPAEMVGVNWQLAAFQQGGKAVDVGTGLTLEFSADGHVSGSGGCNSFNGDYTAGANGQLTISKLASTLKICSPDEVNTRETAYFQALEAVATYALEGSSKLTLTTSAKDTLSYTTGAAAGLPKTGGDDQGVVAVLAAIGGLALLAGLVLRRRLVGRLVEVVNPTPKR